jgi:hypothetical protein
MQVNHIAILVRGLAAVSDSLPAFCKRLPVEDQPGEGTREQYIDVDGEDAVMLLLVQAVADGPYSCALAKRGPGLHHIGCVTSSITDEINRTCEGRLLLHPASLAMYSGGVVWLCRPGVPFLVELMQTSDPIPSIRGGNLRLPSDVPIPEYIRSFSDNLVINDGDDRRMHIAIGERRLRIDPDLG